MRFYNNTHPYYCGIDLHARTLYVCIVDQVGEVLVHKEIGANPEKLQKILTPYIGNIIVGVECMHCWHPKGTSVGRTGSQTSANNWAWNLSLVTRFT